MNLISILLATYNDEKYVIKSINSILKQSYEKFELLIGFNGTKDSTKELIKTIKDSRIRIFDYKDDIGKAKTLNKLLKESKGDFIAIQDGDDIWKPKKLEKQIFFLKYFDIVGTQITYIDEKGNYKGEPKLELEDEKIKSKSLSGINQIANTSSIINKKCLLNLNGWKEDLDGIEDYDLWIRCIKNNYKFMNLNTSEVLHRIHPSSNFNTKKYNLKKIL